MIKLSDGALKRIASLHEGLKRFDLNSWELEFVRIDQDGNTTYRLVDTKRGCVLTDQIYEPASQVISDLIKAVPFLLRLVDFEQEDIISLSEALDRAIKENKNLKRSISELEDDNMRYQDKIEELEDELESSSDVQELVESRDEALEERDNVNKQLEESQEQVEGLQEQNQEHVGRIQELESEVESLTAQIESLTEDLEDAKEAQATAESEIEELKSILDSNNFSY